MSIPTPTLQLMTDASRSGWSGVLLPHKVVGIWPRLYSDQSSNWLELMAIYLSIQHFLPFLQGEGVLIMSDNTTAVACLLHQGTLRSDSLMCLSQSILEYCLLHSITPVPKHLCGALNMVADQGSRRVISTEVSGCQDIPMDIVSGRSLSGGSFRHTLQYPPPQLCFSFSGSFGSRLQCLISSMGRLGLPLLVPSGTSPPSDSTSPLQVQGQRSLNSSLLCSIRLVHSFSSDLRTQFLFRTSTCFRSPTTGRFSAAIQPFFPFTCGDWRSLLGSCFSDQTNSILCLAHKPSTTSQYQSVWSLFLNFLGDRGQLCWVCL
ncbi:unnamed protein product [Meganyctiphanes norvegica]|uniref:Reverse transcriptase RNase H-like domain-containing protein n=1 Tax=Meganyctiphanes norvegica TaxID=48144 RepID=A0AAV2SS81_MEGNR